MFGELLLSLVHPHAHVDDHHHEYDGCCEQDTNNYWNHAPHFKFLHCHPLLYYNLLPYHHSLLHSYLLFLRHLAPHHLHPKAHRPLMVAVRYNPYPISEHRSDHLELCYTVSVSISSHHMFTIYVTVSSKLLSNIIKVHQDHKWRELLPNTIVPPPLQGDAGDHHLLSQVHIQPLLAVVAHHGGWAPGSSTFCNSQATHGGSH